MGQIISPSEHKNFVVIEAETHKEFGSKYGERFGESARRELAIEQAKPDWGRRRERAARLIPIADQNFPDYMTELRAYAEAACIPDFLDFWTLSLENEVDDNKNIRRRRRPKEDRCTGFFVNGGNIIAQSEDWDVGSEHKLFVAVMRIGKLIRFGLEYVNTLGGTSVTANSHGLVSATQTLHSRYAYDDFPGNPRHMFCRRFSELKHPEDALASLALDRNSFYNQLLISRNDRTKIDIEGTATHHRVIRLDEEDRWGHTNHFRTDLRQFDTNDPTGISMHRLRALGQLIGPSMSMHEVKAVLERSPIRRRMKTIGDIMIDTQNCVAWVWLRRERNDEAGGWRQYDLKEILGWKPGASRRRRASR